MTQVGGIRFLRRAAAGEAVGLRSVRIDHGNSGTGFIEFAACRDDRLRQFAEISETVVIR